ncbi:MAG TPA: glycine/sarcosine/betaine reductase selenoprotein B family protein [Dehalococcoidia bacterium]|nr:glycine/sarcosine/betaine reductase selenoprotein B family protein [Dehalococcoidia bacterium]
MPVDSFKFLPGSIAAYYRGLPAQREEPLPFTRLSKPLDECRFALVTTAGIHQKGVEPPFDTEREKREPFWGDPTFRRIPRDVRQEEIGACHLHTNNRDVLLDLNIALPVHRFAELEAEGTIGSLVPTGYSFMGYQMNTTEWRERYGPEVAALMKGEGVDAVLLTPF